VGGFTAVCKAHSEMRSISLLDVGGLSLMYKAFIRSCLEYGHLLYYGAANTHLCGLDSLQHRAEGICSTTFSSLSSYRQAAAFGLICKLLDGEGCGNLH